MGQVLVQERYRFSETQVKQAVVQAVVQSSPYHSDYDRNAAKSVSHASESETVVPVSYREDQSKL